MLGAAGRSTKKFVQTAQRCRTVPIRTAGHVALCDPWAGQRYDPTTGV